MTTMSMTRRNGAEGEAAAGAPAREVAATKATIMSFVIRVAEEMRFDIYICLREITLAFPPQLRQAARGMVSVTGRAARPSLPKSLSPSRGSGLAGRRGRRLNAKASGVSENVEGI